MPVDLSSLRITDTSQTETVETKLLELYLTDVIIPTVIAPVIESLTESERKCVLSVPIKITKKGPQAGYWNLCDKTLYLFDSLTNCEELIDVLLHEFAHCVVDCKAGFKPYFERETNPFDPHGQEWKAVMEQMGRSTEPYKDFYWYFDR